MREILFRGKRIDNGKWVEGYYLCLCFSSSNPLHIIVDKDGQYHKVDPDTVGQFTGLTDKNGRKVFEGDILKEDDIVHEGEIQLRGDVWSVDMRKGCWVVENAEKWDFLGTNAARCAVIGNIHDNPELLDQ